MSTYPTTTGGLSLLAAVPATNTTSTNTTNTTNATSSPNNSPDGFFQTLAAVWSTALNNQANVMEQDAQAMNTSADNSPGSIVTMTADSLMFSFLAQSASTSDNSAGDALNTLARKQ
ncbi:MAG: hypothetical protein JO133_03570 [Burkholderiaceae bacterium]|nr:hypothetical protein [Burkholderiaceae bacterium]